MHLKNLFLGAIFLAGALGNPEPQANHTQPTIVVTTYSVPTSNVTISTIPSSYTSVIVVTRAPMTIPPSPTAIVSTLLQSTGVNVTISSTATVNASAVTGQPDPTRAPTTTWGTGIVNTTASGTGSASASSLASSQPINAVNPNGAEATVLNKAVGAGIGLLVMLSFFSA
ncbi:hypothetical protein FS749_000758 [Ceratobasidium sp. UAMH 11750]|nr:hypothetical protein FS749_000758 [Ceratobasidium sp. UAMH 11750]